MPFTIDFKSLKVQDSNAIILPGKKNNKKGKNKVSAKHKIVQVTGLSKSLERKLKKLQEDKEKKLLLKQSLETLEKYKIGEATYSLMWSLRNLGQVETAREKHLRGLQFSKAGLELPTVELPMKRKANDSTRESRSDSKRAQSRRGCISNDSSCPMIGEREVLHDISVSDSCVGCASGFEPSLSHKETSYEKQSVLGDLKNFMCTSNCNAAEIVKSMDRINEYPRANISISSNPADGPPRRSLTAPVLVHVSRPKEILNKRNDLPIVMMEQEIMEAINDNNSVIITGETGCGKTTQVPQFLYEAGFGSAQHSVHSGMIGVTQPRRVAVLATAKRVAFELGLHLGKEIGYQVQHDKRVGGNCSIKFMTDGILLRELQNDILLKRYSIIILDEAHERSLNTDILIGMLFRIIKMRQKIYEEQKHEIPLGKRIRPEDKTFPLKLVLMSATLQVEDLVPERSVVCELPPVIKIPARQYPVTVHYSKKTETEDYLGQAYKMVLSINRKLPSGGILVFVTGQREVETLCQKLRQYYRKVVAKSSRQSNDVPAAFEGNFVVHRDNNKTNEAFEIEGNFSHHRTDQFNLFDQYDGDSAEDEPDNYINSDEDGDLEVFHDDGNLFNLKNLDSDGKLADVLREDGNLASLKAAFEALTGKNTLKPDFEVKEVSTVTSGGSDRSNPSLLGKMGDADGPTLRGMCVIPLYAMLPTSAQLRVFDEVKEGERLVVVATNIAETSLTIPGIKYVVDTGREKVKIYNSSNGMETYEVQWISKASADQRKGRAGRTGPGHCYRLYSSAVFNDLFPDFSCAEISKVPIDGVVLLIKSMGINKVKNFPFPTPPDDTAIKEAECCLKVLKALDTKGKVTPLGKAMAQYPLSPRHSRMLLTVIQIMEKGKSCSRPNLVLGYTVAAAAALSFSITRFEGNYADRYGLKYDETFGSADNEKVLDKEEKGENDKASHRKFLSSTSDALSIACALHSFELYGDPMGLHLETMEKMSKLRNQILQIVFYRSLCDSQQDFSWTHGTIEDVECAWKVSKHYLLPNEEEILCQAICAGWVDRVAKRGKGHLSLSDEDRKVSAVRYQACMVKETVFLHRRSSISKYPPEFLVYSELFHTKRSYIHCATSVKQDWLIEYGSSFCTFSSPRIDKDCCYDTLTDQVYCWKTPTFGPHLWQLPQKKFPIENESDRVTVFAYSLLAGKVLPCLRSAKKFLAAAPAIMLRPESSGHKRVVNLINKLQFRRRAIYSCAMLREAWDENPGELYPEIRDWFMKEFHNQFEELWAKMHCQVLFEAQERSAMRG